MRWRDWWEDVTSGLTELGRRHLAGVALELGAALLLAAAAAGLAWLLSGGRP